MNNNNTLVNEACAMPLLFFGNGKEIRPLFEDNDQFNKAEPIPLNETEKDSLGKCEEIIKKGRGTFLEVAAALFQIRADKLYRGKYEWYEDYFKQEWQFSTDNKEECGGEDNAITLPEQPKKDVAELMEALEWARELVNHLDETIEIGQFHLDKLATTESEAA